MTCPSYDFGRSGPVVCFFAYHSYAIDYTKPPGSGVVAGGDTCCEDL